MVFWYQNCRFLAIFGVQANEGETEQFDQMASRAKLLTILPPSWLLSCWLGGLVGHFLETLGACYRHFERSWDSRCENAWFQGAQRIQNIAKVL